MSDEKQGRGRPPKDPLLSGYGETKLLSVKVPAAQYDQILFYIQQRFEAEGLHLGVSDVVRFALVKLGINGIAEGKNAVNDAADAADEALDSTAATHKGVFAVEAERLSPQTAVEAPPAVLLTESGIDATIASPPQGIDELGTVAGEGAWFDRWMDE